MDGVVSMVGGPIPIPRLGVGMRLRLSHLDAEPRVDCECGHSSFGDSLNDAVLAWTEHVTEQHGEEL